MIKSKLPNWIKQGIKQYKLENPKEKPVHKYCESHPFIMLTTDLKGDKSYCRKCDKWIRT